MVRLTFPLILLIFLLLQVPDTVIRKVPSLQPTRLLGGGRGLAARGVLINAAVIICDIFASCSSGFSRGRKKKIKNDGTR